eukprot:TRINITY_DN13452_c0_g1_i1.p1 TRINITY_DN13452_c0_g1~~TRINITY_DN13452_c0_g1_i1.p1  ORF type:complete len:464 (-),score=80.97 TRINITY_DN13452_c0_g1_i1:29-1420(-)
MGNKPSLSKISESKLPQLLEYYSHSKNDMTYPEFKLFFKDYLNHLIEKDVNDADFLMEKLRDIDNYSLTLFRLCDQDHDYKLSEAEILFFLRSVKDHDFLKQSYDWESAENLEELSEILNNTQIRFFHTHVYFKGYEQRKVAVKLRREIVRMARLGIINADVGSIWEVPGDKSPHTQASFEVQCSTETQGKVISYIMLHRANLSILIHPVAINEYLNHTERAMWLGTPLPLDLEYLEDVERREQELMTKKYNEANDDPTWGSWQILCMSTWMIKSLNPTRYGILEETSKSDRITKIFSDYQSNVDTQSEVLAYWIRGNSNVDEYKFNFNTWFPESEEVDVEISDRYSELLHRSLNGDIDDWMETQRGSLALVLLLDQFSRVLEDPNEFKRKAQEIALKMIEDGCYLELSPIERHFLFFSLVGTPYETLGTDLINSNYFDSPSLQKCQFDTLFQYQNLQTPSIK